MRTLILSLLLMGCAARNTEALKRVRFRGNGTVIGTRDFNVRTAMVQQQSKRFAWLAPSRQHAVLDRETLELDAWRIETWYAHRGFFDARFLGWQLVTVRPETKRRPAVYKAIGHVQEGEPSMVRIVTISGLDELHAPTRRLLETRVAALRGARFELEDVRSVEAELGALLQDRGYARAQVVARIDAYPLDRVVDLAFATETGQQCVFGPVQTSAGTRDGVGLEAPPGIPARLVQAEISVEEGKLYQVSELRRTQQRLFGLGVFSVVNVLPDLDAANGDEIPVRIELSETKFKELRLGGGLLVESGRQDVHLSAGIRHVNLFERIVGVKVGARGGYAWLTNFGEVGEEGLAEVSSSSGPTALSTLDLTIPHFPRRDWSLTNAFSFELGVEEGYRFATPEFSPLLSGQLRQGLTVGLGYSLRYFDYIDLQLDQTQLRNTPLALDFSDPYTLSALSQRLQIDSRDDPMSPRRGHYYLYEITEAGGPLGGQFNFVRLAADHRIYRPIVQVFGRLMPSALTGRLNAGWILPYGDEERARVPYAERLYLGGTSSVRGWQRNRLGPYICESSSGLDCVSDYDTVQPTSDVLPIGGTFALSAGTELRLYHPSGFGMTAFSDAGMAWEDAREAWPPRLQPTFGVGGRYKSPIGPARLDLAYRPPVAPMFDLEPRFSLHFSIGEAY